jgi:membrane-associated protein
MHPVLRSALGAPGSPVLASALGPDHAGVAVLSLILFAECGLLIGFFLPGDTILFATGITVGLDHHGIAEYLVIAPLAAIIGNLVGYWIGYRGGPAVFNRPDSRFFRPEYVERTRRFFDRFGPMSIIAGRFVPIVRTVVTVMAGVARIRFVPYAVYSVIGGVIWVDGVFLLGHQLSHVHFVEQHKGDVDIAVIAVVVIALLPALLHFVQSRRRP